MTNRRKWIAAAAGFAGLATAARMAKQYGLVPPDSGGIYGPGETLTYAAHRLLTRNSLAREFSRDQISKDPFANGRPPRDEAFLKHQADGFRDWRLTIDGLVSNPGSFSLADLRGYPVSSQITQLACEEGWSFIAEWTGVPLRHVLEVAGMRPGATHVVYYSIQEGWWDSIDMADALHPQTQITYAFNDGDLPVGHGGPLRLRVPRQLGYKSVKYITRLTVTDNIKSIGNGLGSGSPEAGYAWYAGM